MKNFAFQILIAVLFATALAACGEVLEAEMASNIKVGNDGPSGPDIDVDSDTDGSTDAAPAQEPMPIYVCKDEDGDGFCTQDGVGKVVDCNDTMLDTNGDGLVDGKQFAPGANDVCDGLDNDCDGAIDEDAAVLALYLDADDDGCGAGELMLVCNPTGYAAINGDCDDSDPAVFPRALDEPGDGIDADCDDELPEEAFEEFISATLTVTTDEETKLVLSYQVFSKWEDLGDWWDVDDLTELWANSSVTAELEVPQNACGIRFSVTFGGGQDKSWACLDNGDADELSELVQSVDFRLGERNYTLDDVQIWSDPAGGCSLVILWNTNTVCAPPIVV